jgi:hypothetical protein
LSGQAERRTIGTVELTVVLEPDPDTDPEDRERLGRQLRDELRELDVDEVATVESAPAPPGAKSGAAASVTEWLVTLSGGGGVFVTVLGTIKAWLGGRAGTHKVTVTIDGDTLELSSATAAERAELLETFVRRHQPA